MRGHGVAGASAASPETLSIHLSAAHQAPTQWAGPQVPKATRCTPCPLPTHGLMGRQTRKKSAKVQHGLCQNNYSHGQPLSTYHVPGRVLHTLCGSSQSVFTWTPSSPLTAERPRLRDAGQLALSMQLGSGGAGTGNQGFQIPEYLLQGLWNNVRESAG